MKLTRKIISLLAHALCVLLISGCTALADNPVREATTLRVTEGKALFDEKCKIVVGEKIYKRSRLTVRVANDYNFDLVRGAV